MGLKFNWFKRFETNEKHAKIAKDTTRQNGHVCDFSYNLYHITFEPIKIYTCPPPQNDSKNLSFVKDTKIVVKKRLDVNVKWNFVNCKFWATPST